VETAGGTDRPNLSSFTHGAGQRSVGRDGDIAAERGRFRYDEWLSLPALYGSRYSNCGANELDERASPADRSKYFLQFDIDPYTLADRIEQRDREHPRTPPNSVTNNYRCRRIDAAGVPNSRPGPTGFGAVLRPVSGPGSLADLPSTTRYWWLAHETFPCTSATKRGPTSSRTSNQNRSHWSRWDRRNSTGRTCRRRPIT